MEFCTVKIIIDTWDPIDLLCCHAPPDEYDIEIRQIVLQSSYIDNISAENLARIIHNVFLESFGEEVFTRSFDESFLIAEKIVLQSR